MRKLLFAAISFCVLSLAGLYAFQDHFKYADRNSGELTVPRYDSSDANLSVPASKRFFPEGDVREVYVSFEFRPDSFAGYPNLFQTAPDNEGLRM